MSGDRDASSDWASRVLGAALDAIFVIDAVGRVEHLNPAAERLFGLTADAAVGRSLAELIVPPDFRPAHWTGLERLAAGGEPRILDRRVELRARRADGTEFPVELTVTRTSDAPPGFTGFLRDLTGLREAEARRREVERILAAAEDLACTGSWELDLLTMRMAWSDGAHRLHGIEDGGPEPTLEGLGRLVHPDDRDRLSDLLTPILEDPAAYLGEPIAFEYRAARADGRLQIIRGRGRVLADAQGRPTRWTGTEQDVTSQRQAEHRLRTHDAVARALDEWESVEEGTVDLLRRVGESLGCSVGSLWVWDAAAGALVCRAFWQRGGIDVGDFEVVARRARLAPGEGPPGRAWRDGLPVLGGPPSRAGRDAVGSTGLHPYVAIPATTGDGPVAVLSYYGFDPDGPPPTLVETLAGIGGQLGRFLAPRRAELEPQILTPRETEVLRLAAEGNTGPEIAAQLVLSPATVKTHFEHVYEKLGATDRAAAVAHAFRTGLLH